jgi:histidinol-phosphate aminotransferase
MKDASILSRLIRPEIRALHAYHVPDATGLIKLDAMENPYAWPEPLKDAWLKQLREVPINRYPDPAATALRATLKQALAVPAGMEVLLGNGSDELIQLIAMAVARPGAVVMAPTPTFIMYQMIASFVGMRFIGIPLTDGFALDLDALRDAIGEIQPAVIFLAYPNNPSGNLWDTAAIEAVLAETAGLVVVDEAYHAFAQQSFMDRLGEFDNLLVMRTLSKQGLAGLRLGVLAGDPAWLAELDKLRLPYNINSLTQASALFALAHQNLLDEQAALLRAERERLFQALAALPGIRVWPSRANFLLFRTLRRPANEVFGALRERGVLIKNLDATLSGCLRVTVGTPPENAAFLAALAGSL